MKKEIKNKKIAFIIAITIIALIVCGSIGYFIYKKYENNKTTGTTWGDTYYTYIASKMADDNPPNTIKIDKCDIQFLDIGMEQPIMVRYYETEADGLITASQWMSLYTINKENEVKYCSIAAPKIEAQFLYNIENKEYAWYIKKEDSNYYEYIKMDRYIKEKMENESATIEGQLIEKDGKPISIEKRDTGEKRTTAKFDDIYIKPEIEENEKFSYYTSMNLKELHDIIKNIILKFKILEQITTEEVKITVENKIQEIETAKKEKAEAEAAAAEAEKIKQEEQAKKEEETKKVASDRITVGNYTLQYGSYFGSTYSGSRKAYMYVGLLENNKLVINNEDYKYSIKNGKIVSSDGKIFEVTGNNKIRLLEENGKYMELNYNGEFNYGDD